MSSLFYLPFRIFAILSVSASHFGLVIIVRVLGGLEVIMGGGDVARVVVLMGGDAVCVVVVMGGDV